MLSDALVCVTAHTTDMYVQLRLHLPALDPGFPVRVCGITTLPTRFSVGEAVEAGFFAGVMPGCRLLGGAGFRGASEAPAFH